MASISTQSISDLGERSSILARQKMSVPGSTKRSLLARAAGTGALAGLVGVAMMTTGEKLEQAITRRDNSYVPGRTLLTILGRTPPDDLQPFVANQAMHWGTGACLGALRGIWSVTGLRGPQAHLAHTVVRLAFDQTFENASGVGAPPAIWPRDEKAVDTVHKAVYSIVTGMVADRLIAPALASRRGVVSH